MATKIGKKKVMMATLTGRKSMSTVKGWASSASRRDTSQHFLSFSHPYYDKIRENVLRGHFLTRANIGEKTFFVVKAFIQTKRQKGEK